MRPGAAFPEGRRLLQAVSKGAVVITAKFDRNCPLLVQKN
jgi:hypothetical protein